MASVVASAWDAFNAFADEPQHLPTEPMMPSFRVPLAAVCVYWVVLFGLKAVLTRTGKVYPVNALFAAHNYILTAISIWLFAGMTYTVLRIGFEYGPFDLYCGTPFRAVNSAALWWGNAFYISKYYELLDTVFLVLRGKPLSVLHMFHHSVVVLVCWLAVHDAQAMGWITVVNNAGVHIFMYFYFARTVLGQKLWWRKYVTRMQIIQFVLDGTTSLPFAYFWYKGVECNGSMRAWVVGNTTGILLFLLFTHFSREDDRKQKALKAKANANANANGDANTTADARAKAE